MTFALIEVDGLLTIRPESVNRGSINAVMPGGWFDLVRLHAAPDLFGFVDDHGHINALPRNVVGSCLLVALGARPYTYAGPVVVTGWREPSDGSEFRDLTRPQVRWLTSLHELLRATLDGAGHPATEFAGRSRAEWREYAGFVRVSDAPPVQVVTLGGGS